MSIDHASLERWRADPVTFITECLVNPHTGQPYELLAAEIEFLKHCFQIDPATGRLLYQLWCYGAPKKTGKTEFAGMLTITFLWLYAGSYPEAVCVANDFDQAQGRVFAAVKRIVEASPLLRSEARITADKIVFPALNATITAIGGDYSGAAGGGQCLACFDEAWGYVSERARRMWDEMIPPPTRRLAARLVVTHAGFTGESELLEDICKRGSQLPLIGKDLRAGDGMLYFWTHDLIAPWQDASWIAEARRTLRPHQYLRMIENKFASSESSFISMEAWDRCVFPHMPRITADTSLPIHIGIDASVKRDSTAIVAVSFDKKTQRVLLVAHYVFLPTAQRQIDFEADVERTIIDLHRRFRIRTCWFDPYQMASSSQRLVKAGVPIEEFTQTPSNLTAASQCLYEQIQANGLAVYPDEKMRTAISRAVALETARGWHIAKLKQAHRIDVVIALAQATLAAVRAQAESDYDFSYTGFSVEEPPPLVDWAREQAERRYAELMQRYGRPVPGIM